MVKGRASQKKRKQGRNKKPAQSRRHHPDEWDRQDEGAWRISSPSETPERVPSPSNDESESHDARGAAESDGPQPSKGASSKRKKPEDDEDRYRPDASKGKESDDPRENAKLSWKHPWELTTRMLPIAKVEYQFPMIDVADRISTMTGERIQRAYIFETDNVTGLRQCDLYEILELKSSASPDDIKSACKKQLQKWHPDKHNNSSDDQKQRAAMRCRWLTNAREILGDNTARRWWDERLRRLKQMQEDDERRAAEENKPSATRSRYNKIPPKARPAPPVSGAASSSSQGPATSKAPKPTPPQPAEDAPKRTRASQARDAPSRTPSPPAEDAPKSTQPSPAETEQQPPPPTSSDIYRRDAADEPQDYPRVRQERMRTVETEKVKFCKTWGT